MADSTVVTGENREPEVNPRSGNGSRSSQWLIPGLAVVALAAALLAAVGPAEHVRTTYSWPPAEVPSASPEQVWYTPLLLVRREPESLSIRVPCTLPRALPRADSPATVLATARFPERSGGLVALRSRDRLTFQVGEGLLGRLPLSPRSQQATEECAYALEVSGGRWTIEGGPEQVALEGRLDRMPIVSGVFSELDVRSPSHPTIDVTTMVHAARASVLQTLAWAIAVVCALAALVLVSFGRGSRGRAARLRSRLRSGVAQAGAADAIVGLVLLGWWVIGPVFYDDGWVVARQSMFSTSGGFSNYYDSFGANHPLGYWIEWLQHWLVDISTAVLVLRVPALVCLAATWVLCRWILARALSSSTGHGGLPLWALTSGFVVGALAWGMTLRPEPMIALLATGVLACAVRFVERETAAPIALSGLLVALALTAHPAGIVAFAPLVAILPRVARWARRRVVVAGSIAAASGAWLVFLAFVGSDIERRRSDAQTIRTYGNAAASWREEIERYADLFTIYYGAPLRRESVALMVLAVLAYIVRSRRERRVPFDVPALGLGLSLLLLVPTPSKWPWHFGTLIGIAAIAVAVESVRLGEEARRGRGWSARPFLVIGAAIVAAAWSWSPRHLWSDLDLRTLGWTLGFETSLVNLAKLAGAIPLVLLAGLTAAELVRGNRRRLPEVPWRVARWTAPVLAVPLVAFTVGVLVVDAVRTSSWTLTRQNLDTLAGDSGCGLADDALVAQLSSARALPELAGTRLSPPAAWIPEAPADGLPRLSLGPLGQESVARSSWFVIPEERSFGLFLGSTPEGTDTPELEWGRAVGGTVKSLDRDEISSALGPEVRSSLVSWRFFPAGELPLQDPQANVVRLVLRSQAASGTALAATAPVTYTNETLTDRLDADDSLSLVPPNLLTYVPCVEQPALHGGVVEVPAQIVAPRDSLWPLLAGDTSPFEGVVDLYRLERLSLSDSPLPPGNVVLYEVDRRISGAAIAAPDETTVVS